MSTPVISTFTGGPALTLYDKDGQVASEAWFKDGYLTTTNPSKARG
ncbi:hypothetical protein [Mobiluncus mulieris]|nr:hypothetical protein [Mobiluncus mulieris]